MAYEGKKERFLDTLREFGGSAGNGTLREALGWNDGLYNNVKEALIDEAAIERGQGRGGSVRLVAPPARRANASLSSQASTSTKGSAARIATPTATRMPAVNGRTVRVYTHDGATRRNIPTAEFESVMREQDKAPVRLAYERRNRDLDPQLVWRGKDEQDWSDLVVQTPPLFIQEKVHPKVIIDDLRRETKARAAAAEPAPDLFADFNGLSGTDAATEFYQHDQHWSNRMIVGDSLSVMASLAEREGLRGQVQCIYIDPPYGIKFNSNFQWSTTTNKVGDGKQDQITREPEQVRAFRDTWRDGIHSYLTYLRDRLTVARDLLHDSGSVFVQIGDDNVHRVRALMDEILGDDNFVAQIYFQTAANQNTNRIQRLYDCILWYKGRGELKFRELYRDRDRSEIDGVFTAIDTISREKYKPAQIKSQNTVERLSRAGRLTPSRDYWKRYESDFPYVRYDTVWTGTVESTFSKDKVYVVQTNKLVIERCVLMTTDPGDLVLDPTCGSGTTAFVAEQWGRRWITVDTSRVAIALARSRIMGARYPYFFLADSPEGQRKEGELTQTAPKSMPTRGDVRLGFVYARARRITLKTVTDNAEIDVIWANWQKVLEPLQQRLNSAVGKRWAEWEIPREADAGWSTAAKDAHTRWWEARIARQKETDASIAAKAEPEYLYDKPYNDAGRIRVAGPFTVESVSPHRTLAVDWNDELVTKGFHETGPGIRTDDPGSVRNFAQMILDNLKAAGVQQAAKEDRITFTSLTGWPGRLICAEAAFMEGEVQRRAGIFVGPEFGTVSRPDLVAAAREAGDAGFDVLIACAFNYDAHSSEFERLGRVPVLKARMNPDLHMGGELKATGSGNLFVVFGEPDIKIEDAGDGTIRVKVFGVDVFKPQTGEVISEGTDGIALWMLDTDYNEESFFVRHAYFLGANDPYKALKTTLKAEIDEAAWEGLYSDVSRPFPKSASGRIAVKIINHLGDEVMKVFAV